MKVDNPKMITPLCRRREVKVTFLANHSKKGVKKSDVLSLALTSEKQVG